MYYFMNLFAAETLNFLLLFEFSSVEFKSSCTFREVSAYSKYNSLVIPVFLSLFKTAQNVKFPLIC